MKLIVKWILCFLGTGVLIFVLVGRLFFYNLFQQIFDEKLKKDAVGQVHSNKATLIHGLLKNQLAFTPGEFDVMNTLSQDERILQLAYFNREGRVRWHKDVTLINDAFEDFKRKLNLSPDATQTISNATESKQPRIRTSSSNSLVYEVAVPFSSRNDLIGLVYMQVSRAQAKASIGSGLKMYAVGVVVILALFGVLLSFFIYKAVLMPLEELRDSVDIVSVKNLELKASPRKDEIGSLAESFSALLLRARNEMESLRSRQLRSSASERQWWQSLFEVFVGDRHAIVMDEDNNVLYTNIALSEETSGAKLHLLDVVDSQQQDLLRLVGRALEKPNELVEGDSFFRDKACHVRVIHLGEGQEKRTVIFFDKARQGSFL